MQVSAIYFCPSYLLYEEVTLLLIINVNEGIAETPSISTWRVRTPLTGVSPAQGHRSMALQHRMKVQVCCPITFGPCLREVAYLDAVVMPVMPPAAMRLFIVLPVRTIHEAGECLHTGCQSPILDLRSWQQAAGVTDVGRAGREGCRDVPGGPGQEPW